MALIRSLSAGTSSLRAHQQRLDVISNNIANVDAIGLREAAQHTKQFSQTFNRFFCK